MKIKIIYGYRFRRGFIIGILKMFNKGITCAKLVSFISKEHGMQFKYQDVRNDLKALEKNKKLKQNRVNKKWFLRAHQFTNDGRFGPG